MPGKIQGVYSGWSRVPWVDMYFMYVELYNCVIYEAVHCQYGIKVSQNHAVGLCIQWWTCFMCVWMNQAVVWFCSYIGSQTLTLQNRRIIYSCLRTLPSFSLKWKSHFCQDHVVIVRVLSSGNKLMGKSIVHAELPVNRLLRFLTKEKKPVMFRKFS